MNQVAHERQCEGRKDLHRCYPLGADLSALTLGTKNPFFRHPLFRRSLSTRAPPDVRATCEPSPQWGLGQVLTKGSPFRTLGEGGRDVRSLRSRSEEAQMEFGKRGGYRTDDEEGRGKSLREAAERRAHKRGRIPTSEHHLKPRSHC